MTRAVFIAAGMTAGLLGATPARAADSGLVRSLRPEIASRCDATTRQISAENLDRAVVASKVASLTRTSDWGENSARAIAHQAFSDAAGTNQAALNLYQRLVQTWVNPSDSSSNYYLPFTAGGVSVTDRSGQPVPAEQAEAVLVAILSHDDSRYAFGCTHSEQPAGADEDTPRVRLSLARTPDDLLQDAVTDKAFAEFAYTRDEVANESSYSIHATLGLIGPRLTSQDHRRPSNGRSRFFAEIRPVALVQYEREGSTTAAEVNNLNFGLQAAGFIQTGTRHTLSHYYTVTARYLTDDRFDSAAWSLAATLTPQFRIFGNDVAADVAPNLTFRWLATLAADHFSVDDPGRKTALLTANQFTRLGFDLDAELRFKFNGDNHLSLRGEYQLREALGGGVGDARLLNVSLAFQPIDHVAVGLTYTRGENIDSLEFGEQWKFTFGLRF